MREFKVGDMVIWTDQKWSKVWEEEYKVYLYGKLAKIIYFDSIINTYILEFKEFINGHDGRLGKDGYCKWASRHQIESLDHLKLKKILQK